MQYALIHIKEDHLHLIDASELALLNNYKEDDLIETKFNEDQSSYVIAYGCFMPSYSERVKQDQGLKLLEDYQDYMYAYTDMNKCVQFGIKEFYTPDGIIGERGNSYMIPFACLLEIDSNFTFHDSATFSRTAFLRMSNLTILENVLNREGVIAISKQEKQKTRNKTIDPDNWKEFVNKDRIYSTAEKIK